MDVFVTGGAGYVGGYVIAALRAEGHRVFGLARSASARRRIASLGGVVTDGDVTVAGPWQDCARRSGAIVHLACPSPQHERRFYEWAPFTQRWVRSMAELEARALPNLIAAARGGDARLVTTTGPAAAGEHGNAWADEQCEGPRSSLGEVQRQIEAQTLDAARDGVAATVLRPGAVYGPDGGFAARVLGAAIRGRVRYVADGGNYVSWVHIEDYAAAYARAIHGGGTGRVVAVVDDEPMTSRESMALLARLAGAGRPASVPAWLARGVVGKVVTGWATQSARVRNTRAKELLGWQPRFGSVREGFADALRRFHGPPLSAPASG